MWPLARKNYFLYLFDCLICHVLMCFYSLPDCYIKHGVQQVDSSIYWKSMWFTTKRIHAYFLLCDIIFCLESAYRVFIFSVIFKIQNTKGSLSFWLPQAIITCYSWLAISYLLSFLFVCISTPDKVLKKGAIYN